MKRYRVTIVMGMVICGLFAVCRTSAANDAAFPEALAEQTALRHEMADAAGQTRSLQQRLGKQGTVLAFVSTECPISNGYVPVLNRLHQQFQPQGIAVVGINSNEGQSRDAVAEHVRKFDIQFPVLKDEHATVAAGLGIETCPMVLVLDADSRPVYQGRIDDRYVRRGGGARDTRRADLEIALKELLAGQAITTPHTEPIGCPLLRKSAPEDTVSTEAAVTYAEHISRVMQKHCQECHRPNGVGPFSLLTYDETVSWAKDIQTFTANRTMPPWLPKSGHENLVNARVLSDQELSQIAAWVENGTPEGDPKLLPEPKTFRDDWQLGEPDIVLKPLEAYTVESEGPDEYRCFVIPTDYDRDLYVKAIEVLPGVRAVVHHVLVLLDSSQRSTKLDQQDPLPGYATSAGFPGFIPSGGLGGWSPGNTPDLLPDGIAKMLPRGSKIVLQVHYHKTGKVKHDQTQLGLYLAKEPINRLTHGVPVLPMDSIPPRMTIPAGEANFEMKAERELSKDTLVLGVTPHMHLLGQDMKVTAVLPDGTERTLIDARWNFNWQESYRYREPVLLPKGTVVKLVAHFDNSEGNPHNPHQPPQTVHWGEQTSDEMCIAFIEATSPTPASSPDELRPASLRDEIRDALWTRFKSERKKRIEAFLSRFRPPQDE